MESTFSLNSEPTLHNSAAVLSTSTLNTNMQSPLRHEDSFYAAEKRLPKREASFYTNTEAPQSPLKHEASFYAVPQPATVTIEPLRLELIHSEQVPAVPPPIEIPDGGLRAWLTILGGWCVVFCTFGATNSFGVFQNLYTLRGTASASTISWIGSLQFFFMFGVGLPAGKLFDEGYFYYTQAFGSIFYVFCWFMLSLADPSKYYQVLLAQGVGMGIASGMLLVPAYSIQAHYFKKRRTLAMGAVSSGTAVGGIVYPILLNQLFEGSAGFAWGVRAAGFLTMGLLIVANAVLRTRLPSARANRKVAKVRAEVGLEMGVGGDGNGGASGGPDMRAILGDWQFMCYVGGTFVVLMGMFFPYFYMQLYTNLHGFPSNLAFYTIAMINGASLPGRLLLNLLADSYGHMTFICPLAILAGGLLFAMFNLGSTGGIVAFSLVYGFATGSFLALLTPLVVEFARSMDEVGIRMGILNFGCALGLLGAGPIYGALLNPGLHWSRPIIFSGVMVLAGSAVMICSRQGLVMRKGTQLV